MDQTATSQTERDTNCYRSVRVRGADCGIEAIMLGCVTSIGGFLFGYDTVKNPQKGAMQEHCLTSTGPNLVYAIISRLHKQVRSGTT